MAAEDPHRSHYALLGGLGVATAITAAPLLNLDVMGDIINLCSRSAQATGLAGTLSRALGAIPGVGPYLIAGTWSSVLASAGIGIGGLLLGSFIGRKFDHAGGIHWGAVIRNAALATSILIALPGLLSGLSIGLTFLSYTLGNSAVAASVFGVTNATLGMLGSSTASGIFTSVGSFMPHFLSCGIAALPALATVFAAHKTTSDSAPHTTLEAASPRQLISPRTQPPHPAFA